MLKRIISIFSISLIITGSFFSTLNNEYQVYADSPTDEWLNVTTNEQLVEAFKYYCKSRDLTIEGSIADGVTSFTTQTFNGICNTLGIDITALQAHLKYQTDSNSGLRFLFDSVGVSLYNQIFAQFLQDNELEVGEEYEDDTIYSGKYFTDNNGYSCVCTIFNRSAQSEGTLTTGELLALGSPYKLDSNNIGSIYGWPVQQYGSQYLDCPLTSTIKRMQFWGVNNGIYINYNASNGSMPKSLIKGDFKDGNTIYTVDYAMFTVVYSVTNNHYNFGIVNRIGNTYRYYFGFQPFYQNEITGSGVNLNITINTGGNTINNNTYEGDTIINNNGDTNYYPDNPDDPDDPDLPPSNPTIPDSGGWQDFSLPDMPNDWLIYGMEKKFPFDIPFNILFALSLLNHEPEIPKFEGDIDLQVCTWHYDIDLTPFDDIATILRKFEVLAFIIGLAILTKNLINWG